MTMSHDIPVLMAVSSETPKNPLVTLTLRGRFLEYFNIKSLSNNSSTVEWVELTEATLGDLDSI